MSTQPSQSIHNMGNANKGNVRPIGGRCVFAPLVPLACRLALATDAQKARQRVEAFCVREDRKPPPPPLPPPATCVCLTPRLVHGL